MQTGAAGPHASPTGLSAHHNITPIVTPPPATAAAVAPGLGPDERGPDEGLGAAGGELGLQG